MVSFCRIKAWEALQRSCLLVLAQVCGQLDHTLLLEVSGEGILLWAPLESHFLALNAFTYPSTGSQTTWMTHLECCWLVSGLSWSWSKFAIFCGRFSRLWQIQRNCPSCSLTTADALRPPPGKVLAIILRTPELLCLYFTSRLDIGSYLGTLKIEPIFNTCSFHDQKVYFLSNLLT